MVIIIAISQYVHLMNSYLVQLDKTFPLCHTLLDKNGIQVFHVRQADQLIDSSIITNITF